MSEEPSSVKDAATKYRRLSLVSILALGSCGAAVVKEPDFLGGLIIGDVLWETVGVVGGGMNGLPVVYSWIIGGEA